MARFEDDHDDHGGFARDLRETLNRGRRRDFLKWIAGASMVPIIGACVSDGESLTDAGNGTDTGSGAGSDTPGGSCANIPEETGGPYPADGTNGPDVLSQSGIVRSDITSSFGGLSGTATGVPLTIKLTLINVAGSCAALSGYAIYLWHADAQGRYSLYSSGVTDQNYLRGVQETDGSGVVTFQSVFPGCYDGRWPHIHFEIYDAVGGTKLRTSQLALPKATCDEVYATSGYPSSATNLAKTSLATDMVFSDGSSLQVPNVVGSTSAGYVASLLVGISQ